MSKQALKREFELDEELDPASLREVSPVKVQATTMTVLNIALRQYAAIEVVDTQTRDGAQSIMHL